MANMMISCCFICVFSFLINEVSPQVTVEAVSGGSVVLPCSSTEHDHKLQDINVHWRHNDGKFVYDIVKGEDSVAEQDQRYKNRTETFPLEYEEGNFSLKLDNLQDTDAGTYICSITPSNKETTVQLIINESKAEEKNKSIDQGNRGEEPGGDVGTSSPVLLVYIVLPVVFIVLIAGFIIFHFRKIIKCLFPSEEQRTEIEIA